MSSLRSQSILAQSPRQDAGQPQSSERSVGRIPILSFAMVLTAWMWFAPTAQAQAVFIENPGFESVSRTLDGGEQTNGIGGPVTLVATRFPFPFGSGIVDWTSPVTVPGWRTRVLPFGSPDQILAGVLRPTELGGTPFINGNEGDNVFAIQAALAGQKTTTLLQPNTRYTLSFLAGLSEFDFNYFFSVSLTAIDGTNTLPIENQPGVTRLALGSFFPPGSVPDGVMRRYEFTYTTPEVLPPHLVGTHVGINIFGSDGIPRVLYDDFALTAFQVQGVPVSPPWGFLALALLLATSGGLALRRHGAHA